MNTTPSLASHYKRLWFESACYRTLLGVMVAYAALGIIGALIPPGVCLVVPANAVCSAQYDWGASIIAREVQFWPVLLAIGTFLVAGPAVTLFRGAHDATLEAKQ